MRSKRVGYKKCVYCQKPNDRLTKNSRLKSKRFKTCCRLCAKDYARIYHVVKFELQKIYDLVPKKKVLSLSKGKKVLNTK